MDRQSTDSTHQDTMSCYPQNLIDQILYQSVKIMQLVMLKVQMIKYKSFEYTTVIHNYYACVGIL